jgi:hypothetical protein
MLYLMDYIAYVLHLWNKNSISKQIGQKTISLHPGLATSPFVCIRDYSGEKSSEIRVDGHDVLLIPRPPNAPPHRLTPRGGWAGRDGWARQAGGWGGALGGGGIRRISSQIHSYAHVGARIEVAKN